MLNQSRLIIFISRPKLKTSAQILRPKPSKPRLWTSDTRPRTIPWQYKTRVLSQTKTLSTRP